MTLVKICGNRTPADVVLIATPIDLRRLVHIEKPALRVRRTGCGSPSSARSGRSASWWP